MSEIIICPKCDHTMAYDSYFKAVICRQCGHREEPVITNADRIRSMSDEELAVFLGDDLPFFSTHAQYFKWLQQPYKEADR